MLIFHKKLQDCIPEAPQPVYTSLRNESLFNRPFTRNKYDSLNKSNAYDACVAANLFQPNVITTMQQYYANFFMKAPSNTSTQEYIDEYYARQCFLNGFYYALQHDANAHNIFTNVISQMPDIGKARLMASNAARVSVKPNKTTVLLQTGSPCILKDILLNTNKATKERLLKSFEQAATHMSEAMPSLTDYALNVIESCIPKITTMTNAENIEILCLLISSDKLTIRRSIDQHRETHCPLIIYENKMRDSFGNELQRNIYDLSRKLTTSKKNSAKNISAIKKLIELVTEAEQHFIVEIYQPRETFKENTTLVNDINKSIRSMDTQLTQVKKDTRHLMMKAYSTQTQERLCSIIECLNSQILAVKSYQNVLHLEAALEHLNQINPSQEFASIAIENLAEVTRTLLERSAAPNPDANHVTTTLDNKRDENHQSQASPSNSQDDSGNESTLSPQSPDSGNGSVSPVFFTRK